MAVSKNKSRSVLGDNPLSQGIFSKTQTKTPTQTLEPKPDDPRLKNQESRLLEKGEREAVNLRLPIELNDWLNELLKVGKRRHGSKFPRKFGCKRLWNCSKRCPLTGRRLTQRRACGRLC